VTGLLAGLRKARRLSYRFGSVSGDVIAAAESVEERSPDPLLRRVVRKEGWRLAGRVLRRLP
jgi:hypothetical protein